MSCKIYCLPAIQKYQPFVINRGGPVCLLSKQPYETVKASSYDIPKILYDESLKKSIGYHVSISAPFMQNNDESSSIKRKARMIIHERKFQIGSQADY